MMELCCGLIEQCKSFIKTSAKNKVFVPYLENDYRCSHMDDS